MEPIKPDEVQAPARHIKEQTVIALNRLIKEHWNGQVASFTHDDIIEAAFVAAHPSPHFSVFEDIEETYRSAGWKVEYSDFNWTFKK